MSTDEPRLSPALGVLEPSPTTIDDDDDGGADDGRTPRRSGLADPLGGATPHPGPAGHELVRGDAVGRHIVLARLGHGGMGVVYAAYDPELDRRVALKLLIGRRHDDPVARTRLLREAQAMARLSHPNVVAVHDVGTVRGQVYLAMELVEGPTLRAWLDAAPRGWRELLPAFVAAGEGLRAAHDAGLVHRDFKPDNVMLGDDGRVRVMDFGLARAAADERPAETEPAIDGLASGSLASPLTRTGAHVGTPRYMAPEQWGGEPATARTDQFAFCVSLWEALHGEPPFAGRDVAELRQSVREGRLRSPRAGQGSRRVPRWLRKVVQRGLAREPEARWPSMRELLAALDRGRARQRRQGALAAVGGLAVVLGASAGFTHYEQLEQVEACREAGEAIAEVWNDDVKASLHAALLASEAPGAEAAYERMVPWVDRFAAEWADARTEVCQQARVEGTRTPELHERSLACLDEQRGELVGVLEGLGTLRASEQERAATGDPKARKAAEREVARLVRQAAPAAAELPRAEACVDPLALARRPALPDDPALRAEVEAQQRALAEARGLHALGLYGPAVAATQAVLAAAEPLGYAPLVVRAREALGTVATVDGKLDLAQEQLERAYVEAASLGDDEVAARAAVGLVLLEGSERANAAAGRLWAKSAEAFVARAGQAEGREGIRLLRAMAALCFHAGQYEEAVEVGTRAASLARAVLGPDHPTSGLAVVSLASAHAELGHVDEAAELFSQSIEILSAAQGPEHPAVATPLGNLAAMRMLQGRWDEARALHERTLAIVEAAYGPRSRRVGVVLANLAALELELGRYAESLALQRRSLSILEESRGPEHPDVGAALVNLADVLMEQGSLDEARTHLERALRLLEQALGPAHASVATPLGRLGRLDTRQGEPARARAHLERAMAIVEQAAGTENPDFGGLLVDLGELELRQGELGAAEAALRRAEAVLAGTPDHPDAVRMRMGLGAVALARGDAALAITSYEQALARLPEGRSRPERRARARFGLARALAVAGEGADPGRARALAEQALADYRTAGIAHAELAREVEAWLRAAGA